MRSFEVFLNGRRVCVAGVGGPGVVSAIITSHLRGTKSRGTAREEIRLDVGGLVSGTNEYQTFVRRKLPLLRYMKS